MRCLTHGGVPFPVWYRLPPVPTGCLLRLSGASALCVPYPGNKLQLLCGTVPCSLRAVPMDCTLVDSGFTQELSGAAAGLVTAAGLAIEQAALQI